MSLSETLTLLMGVLLALVLVDGSRRLLKKRENNLRFASQFIELQENENIDDKDENPNPLNQEEHITSEDLNENSSKEIKNKNSASSIFLIINLRSKTLDQLSLPLIQSELKSMGMSYSEKGYFYYNSLSEEQINFTLLNGMKPGVFDNNKTSMVSLVLDTKKNNNPVESFEKMLELAHWFSDSFDTDLLDESRNFLTKQMIDHMRQQAEDDHQKYLIAAGSV